MVLIKDFDFEKNGLIQASTVTRLLVVSFFIALSLGFVEGAKIELLAQPFLSDALAVKTTHGVMLLLSILVLVGILRRPAALILALMVFWPSYMALYAGGDVSAFWRDLALIGGLMMSATEVTKAVEDMPRPPSQERRMEAADIAPEVLPQSDPVEGDAFREDFDLARSV